MTLKTIDKLFLSKVTQTYDYQQGYFACREDVKALLREWANHDDWFECHFDHVVNEILGKGDKS